MISPDKIEEWLREVEERPASAPNILRYIARRLSDLAARSEDLQAENLALRSGTRIEEYEARIANLEYQVELLKRQLGGAGPVTVSQSFSVLLYNPLGQVLRFELDPAALDTARVIGTFAQGALVTEDQPPPGLLVAGAQEELLFIFDSGRTAACPVDEIPALEPTGLAWEHAFYQEPRGGEELAAVVPVARMSLYDFCVQFSRRGFVKKIREDFFESHLSNQYIGSGVKLPADRTCGLALSGKDDLVVLVSREGAVVSHEVSRLPLTIEEGLRLEMNDYITAGFSPGKKEALLFLTTRGKAIHRQRDWLEPAASFKSKGQAVFSKDKRAQGVRLAGAAAVDEGDWCTALLSDGRLLLCPAGELFSSGALPIPPGGLAGASPEVLAFTAFEAPSEKES